jgi:hypothetical protein
MTERAFDAAFSPCQLLVFAVRDEARRSTLHAGFSEARKTRRQCQQSHDLHNATIADFIRDF